VAQARLAEATGAPRAALARDVYSYLHLPMVAGIVLFAFGLKTTLHDVNDPLRIVPALGLVGGIALYLLAHVALRLRIGGGFGRATGREGPAVGLVPVARVVPALTALGLAAAVCAALIGYEAIRYREARAWIRSRRGAFSMKRRPVPAEAGGGTAVQAQGSRHDAQGQPVLVTAS
jgi:low temperature requirement protein LtrA